MSEILSNVLFLLVLLAGFAALVVLVRHDTFAGSGLVPRDRTGEHLRREPRRD